MSIGKLFHIGVSMLSSTLDNATSTILAQLGSVTEEYVFSDSAEMYGCLGLTSRPSNPTKGEKAAECVAIKGDRDVIIAARDTRGQAIYGNLKEGETCLYAAGADGLAQAKIFLKGDGSITFATTATNTKGGDQVSLTLAPTGLMFQAPWGNLSWDQYGFHLVTLPDGSRIDMGGLTLPAPLALLSPLTSYVNLTAATVGAHGSVVELGNGPDYQCALIHKSMTAAEIAAAAGPLTLLPGSAPLGNMSSCVKISSDVPGV